MRNLNFEDNCCCAREELCAKVFAGRPGRGHPLEVERGPWEWKK